MNGRSASQQVLEYINVSGVQPHFFMDSTGDVSKIGHGGDVWIQQAVSKIGHGGDVRIQQAVSMIGHGGDVWIEQATSKISHAGVMNNNQNGRYEAGMLSSPAA